MKPKLLSPCKIKKCKGFFLKSVTDTVTNSPLKYCLSVVKSSYEALQPSLSLPDLSRTRDFC